MQEHKLPTHGKKLTSIALHASLLLALTAVFLATSSQAQAPEASISDLATQGHSVTVATPVYSQIVMFSYPPGFKPAFAKNTGSSYMQEYVLEGETVEKWTQMVTLSGAKGLSTNQALTPQRFVEFVASGFQRTCPSSFAARSFGTLKISGHEAFVALVGCGTVPTEPARSEIAMVLAVKGSNDYYTIQWAERATPSPLPILDGEKWIERLKVLSPIKACDRVPNEQAPYPSCINQK
ncbi:hypothetical protein B9Z43_00030 [Limnohabitans sp. MMS-10A-192]|jgi:hypothetical protein|uniref:hypothetical protein n=1 Tax=Limnohabitans sp. MMS-10A-192 TaxID=1835769 RepID=UPI000D3DBD7C|nr:hypothetical protein [Limnohabitans sp. MMS-10A-192]PUE21627.1 hypothetical protein B9Z43_00030 [Limnohabitans sp. MMS-10A-192]